MTHWRETVLVMLDIDEVDAARKTEGHRHKGLRPDGVQVYEHKLSTRELKEVELSERLQASGESPSMASWLRMCDDECGRIINPTRGRHDRLGA